MKRLLIALLRIVLLPVCSEQLFLAPFLFHRCCCCVSSCGIFCILLSGRISLCYAFSFISLTVLCGVSLVLLGVFILFFLLFVCIGKTRMVYFICQNPCRSFLIGSNLLCILMSSCFLEKSKSLTTSCSEGSGYDASVSADISSRITHTHDAIWAHFGSVTHSNDRAHVTDPNIMISAISVYIVCWLNYKTNLVLLRIKNSLSSFSVYPSQDVHIIRLFRILSPGVLMGFLVLLILFLRIWYPRILEHRLL